MVAAERGHDQDVQPLPQIRPSASEPIRRLRELPDEMDRAVLHAYGWHNLAQELRPERVEALKALEVERHARAEHKRVLTERNWLAEEAARFAEPILEIAKFLAKADVFDRRLSL